MKNILEWIVVACIAIIGLCMITMLLWAFFYALCMFIYYFLYTLGAKFIYLSAGFFICLFILIRFAEDAPQIEGK